jgi:hypothetical protein
MGVKETTDLVADILADHEARIAALEALVAILTPQVAVNTVTTHGSSSPHVEDFKQDLKEFVESA